MLVCVFYNNCHLKVNDDMNSTIKILMIASKSQMHSMDEEERNSLIIVYKSEWLLYERVCPSVSRPLTNVVLFALYHSKCRV